MLTFFLSALPGMVTSDFTTASRPPLLYWAAGFTSICAVLKRIMVEA